MLLTNLKNHNEGAGSLYQLYITTWILCKLYNKKYIHNIPENIHHYKSNKVELKKYINDWESMFAFLNDADNTDNVYEQIKNNKIIEITPDVKNSRKEISELSDNLYYFIRNSKQIFDKVGHLYETSVKNELRQQFHNNIIQVINYGIMVIKQLI